MINRSSIRSLNRGRFKRCIELRKQGLSYSEIQKVVPVAKSTLQNWLTFAGLTLTKEHLQIQLKKRLEKQRIATIASKVTRAKKKDLKIQKFLGDVKKYFNEPFFVGGILLYEAEGSKGSRNGFSNSDYRLIVAFIKFLETYLSLSKYKNMKFRLYIHETRKRDLSRILNFWAKKLSIKPGVIKLSWKHNKVVRRRENLDYVGQLEVRISGISYFTSKMMAISDIILTKYKKS